MACPRCAICADKCAPRRADFLDAGNQLLGTQGDESTSEFTWVLPDCDALRWCLYCAAISSLLYIAACSTIVWLRTRCCARFFLCCLEAQASRIPTCSASTTPMHYTRHVTRRSFTTPMCTTPICTTPTLSHAGHAHSPHPCTTPMHHSHMHHTRCVTHRSCGAGAPLRPACACCTLM